MATKNIYLLDPYNDVIKVNAVTDSVFRLDLNNSIIYTQQELWDKLDGIEKLNASEDDISRIARWIYCEANNIGDLRFKEVNVVNLIQCNNSYSDNLCGGIANLGVALFKHYYGNTCDFVSGGDINGGHSWNCFDTGCYDNINKLPFYKGKYVLATFEDLQADDKLYIEPLKCFGLGLHYSLVNYTSYVTNSTRFDAAAYPLSTIDDIYMRMPGGSSFIFPVKSPNIPRTENSVEMTQWANLVLTIPTGITGNVEMPFNLLQITGAGVVTVDGVTYTLPTDEATLKTACQTTQYTVEKWLHSFTIIANTGGLEAEFLVNRIRVLLFHDNVIDYTMTSGSITFERHKTTIPQQRQIVSFDLKDSGSFTFDLNNFFTKSKSMFFPIARTIWDDRTCYFTPNSNGRFSEPKRWKNYTPDTVTAITADTATIDKCFSAKLTPGSTTFTDTLTLSFTVYDGSSVYYTTNGDTPTSASTSYTAPFTISATTTVKWINIRSGYANSHVNSRTITKS